LSSEKQRDCGCSPCKLHDVLQRLASFHLAHNARSREAVDAMLEEARAAGVLIIKNAQDTDRGGYSGYFSDPAGFLWEVAWKPNFPID
jgi:predicted lactoylglutathione lyase